MWIQKQHQGPTAVQWCWCRGFSWRFHLLCKWLVIKLKYPWTSIKTSLLIVEEFCKEFGRFAVIMYYIGVLYRCIFHTTGCFVYPTAHTRPPPLLPSDNRNSYKHPAPDWLECCLGNTEQQTVLMAFSGCCLSLCEIYEIYMLNNF